MQELAVFVFDKTRINRSSVRNEVLELMHRHLEELKNMQKYSAVCLKLVLQAKENRRYLAFATEPVIGSLANVIGEHPSDLSSSRVTFFNKFCLSETDIKYGVTVLAETLSYLHLSESLIHCDVSPRNIIICTNRTWKLSGFYFSTSSTKKAPFQQFKDEETDSLLQPDVNFSCPCLTVKAPSPQSDVFSMGMVITAVYNQGISLIEGAALTHVIHGFYTQATAETEFNDRIVCAFNAIKNKVPEGLHTGLSHVLKFNPQNRPTAQQFLMLGYYDDPVVKCLKQLSSLDTVPEKQREVFFLTQLSPCCKRFPQVLLETHVYPVLTCEFRGGNLSSGVVSVLLACMSRYPSGELCPWINLIIQQSHVLSPQALQIALEYLPEMLERAAAEPVITNPMLVFERCLFAVNQSSMALNCFMTYLEKSCSSVRSFRQQFLAVFQCCMNRLVEVNDEKQAVQLVMCLIQWIVTDRDSKFAEQVLLWLTQLLSDHLPDEKSLLIDTWNTMLSDSPVLSHYTHLFKSKVIPRIEEMFKLSAVSVIKRQQLRQLLLNIESGCSSGESLQCKRSVPNATSLKSSLTSKASSEGSAVRYGRHMLPIINVTADQSAVEISSPDSDRSSSTLHSPHYSQTSRVSTPESVRLFALDVTDSRRASFGDLMADIDQRTVQSWKQNSPLLTKGGSDSSSQNTTPSDKRSFDDSQCTRTVARPTRDDSNMMEVLLARLDSLAIHFSLGSPSDDR